MKVLVGFIGDGKQGGIDRYLLNFLESVVSDNVRVDFLTTDNTMALKEKLMQYNSHIFQIPTLKNPFKQYFAAKRLLQSGQYDVLYLNISTAINFVVLFAGWRVGVEKRIIHSHSSGNDCQNKFKRNILNISHGLCKQFLYRLGNRYCACSQKAAEWLFPYKLVKNKQVNIIYNAVDIDKFSFDCNIRKNVRKKLGIGEELLLGHVGNFVYQKNHRFLIDIFRNVVKLEPKSKMVLVGTGPLYDDIVQYVDACDLTEKVLFLGWRKDVADLYQAMDMFLLPSNFEWLPIVGVEAQSVGLKCIFSDKISDEVKLTQEAEFLPINKPNTAAIWAKHIVSAKDYHREKNLIFQNKELYNLIEQKDAYLSILQS